MSSNRSRRKRKRDDDDTSDPNLQPPTKRRKRDQTEEDDFEAPSRPARRVNSSGVNQLRDTAAKATPFPGRTTQQSTRPVIDDDEEPETVPEIPEVEEDGEGIDKFRTPEGPRMARTSLSASEVSAYSVYSSYKPASLTKNVLRYSTVALIWLILVVSLYCVTYRKMDPTIPNGRPYCHSEDAWEGRMSITFKGADCQVCPLQQGWYCESPRLVSCDEKYYDTQPIGAICGKRESDDWKWSLGKIDELRSELRIEKGKEECGCDDAGVEISSCELHKKYYDEWLGERESTEELAEEFESDYFSLFLDVLKQSQEHFQVNIEEFNEDETDEEGVTRRVQKTIISSVVPELTFGCAVKVFLIQYKWAFFFLVFLSVVYGITYVVRHQNAKFEQNVADLASMVLTRLKLGKEGEQSRVADLMKEEIKDVPLGFQVDVDELWKYVEEIVEADNRIFVDCNIDDEKVWTWNGGDEEDYDSPEMRRKSMVTPQKISPKYTKRRLFRKSLGKVSRDEEMEEVEDDVLQE